jgi:hypothetical protein
VHFAYIEKTILQEFYNQNDETSIEIPLKILSLLMPPKSAPIVTQNEFWAIHNTTNCQQVCFIRTPNTLTTHSGGHRRLCFSGHFDKTSILTKQITFQDMLCE